MIKQGLKINTRYQLRESLGQGSFGEVWTATDIILDVEVAIKFSKDMQIFLLERDILIKVTNQNYEGLPKFYASGLFEGHYFIVMQKLGRSLFDCIKERERLFSKKTVLQIGIQLLRVISNLHDKNVGYIHLDIKPDNIVIQSNDLTSCESSLLNLLDFSVSKKYIDDKGFHLENFEIDEFNGNITYASLYQMQKQGPSRRDDLVSILYLLIYLKEGSLPWTKNFKLSTLEKNFEKVLSLKRLFHNQIAQQNKCVFKNLIRYVDLLDFDEQPDYQYMITQMQNEIRYMGARLDWVMDWSQADNIKWIKSYKKIRDKFEKITKINRTIQKTFSTFIDSPDVSKNIKGMSQTDMSLIDKSQSQISNFSPLFPISKNRALRKHTVDSSQEIQKSGSVLNKINSGLSVGKFYQNQAINSNIQNNINAGAVKLQNLKNTQTLPLIPEIDDEIAQKSKAWSPFRIVKIQEDLKEDDSESYSCGDINQEVLKIPFPQQFQHQEYESPKKVILQPLNLQSRLQSKRQLNNLMQFHRSLSQAPCVKAAQNKQQQQHSHRKSSENSQNIKEQKGAEKQEIQQNIFKEGMGLDSIQKISTPNLQPQQIDQRMGLFQRKLSFSEDESELGDTEIDEKLTPRNPTLDQSEVQVKKVIQKKTTVERIFDKHLGSETLIQNGYHNNDLKQISRKNMQINNLIDSKHQSSFHNYHSDFNVSNNINFNQRQGNEQAQLLQPQDSSTQKNNSKSFDNVAI
eukprot:403364043